MWQCQTYPGPMVGSKLYWLMPGVGAPGPVAGAVSGANLTLIMHGQSYGGMVKRRLPVQRDPVACVFGGIQGLTTDYLELDEVEVYGMGVACYVDNNPVLGGADTWRLGHGCIEPLALKCDHQGFVSARFDFIEDEGSGWRVRRQHRYVVEHGG